MIPPYEPGSHNPFMVIDTLAIVKMLEAAGTPHKQAEAHARVWGEVITHNLSSKMDIAEVRRDIAEVKKDIAEVKKDIVGVKKDIAEIRTDIENLRKETKTDIENLRKDTMIEIAKVMAEMNKIKFDTIKWMMTLMLGQAAVFIGLLKLVGH